MKRIIAFVLVVALIATLVPCIVMAGQAGKAKNAGPALDYTLMGFKDHGAWYFLCSAPVIPYRTGPHYLTYAPPPPPCVVVPCAPAMPPQR